MECLRDPVVSILIKQVVVQNTGGDNVTPLFLQTKYTEDVAPIRIASGMEAVLISAEALNEYASHDGCRVGRLCHPLIEEAKFRALPYQPT